LVFGAQAAQLRNSRYSSVNVWRSIGGPVLDTPLALCDARSIGIADLVCAEVRYPQRTGEIYLLRHAARLRDGPALSVMRIGAMAELHGVQIAWTPFLLGPIFMAGDDRLDDAMQLAAGGAARKPLAG
jgi:hypothetical protein